MSQQVGKVRDAILLKRAICEGDTVALSLLHAEYYPRIKCYITSRIGSSADAEDLAQNVFVELCANDGKHLPDPCGTEPYLFGIARNLIRQHHRDSARLPKPLDAATLEAIAADRRGPTYPTEPTQDSDDTQQLILKALSHLPPAGRQALKLAIFDESAPCEAAKKANCSVSTFYKRLSRARKALARLLMEPHHTQK